MTQGSWRGWPRPRAPARSGSRPALPPSPAQAHSEPVAAGAPCASVGPGLWGHRTSRRRPPSPRHPQPLPPQPDTRESCEGGGGGRGGREERGGGVDQAGSSRARRGGELRTEEPPPPAARLGSAAARRVRGRRWRRTEGVGFCSYSFILQTRAPDIHHLSLPTCLAPVSGPGGIPPTD